MKFILKLEELASLVLGIYLFSTLDFAWWWFLALLLTPDIGMLGYVINSKVGAWSYNIFHHKGIAISVFFAGIVLQNEIIQLIGIILFSHAAFDRVLGYGLKYEKGFKYTHLGDL